MKSPSSDGVSAEDVRQAYRMLLGREPESAEAVARHQAAATDLNGLRARFLSSAEFHRNNARELLRWQADRMARRVHPPVQHQCGAEELARLFSHVGAVWSRLGEVEPHYSVVSAPRFKPDVLERSLSDFWASGRGEAALLQAELGGLGFRTEGFAHVLELGCGVGRVTRHLAPLGRVITACDVSTGHLRLAEERLASDGVTNVELLHLSSPAEAAFPSHDLFYSRIVLQHNPPPVMRAMLKAVLAALVPGGVAVFQLPTHIEGYSFEVTQYLAAMDSIDNQEIHALPQAAVFDVVVESGCRLIAAYRDNSLSNIAQVSERFVVTRPV